MQIMLLDFLKHTSFKAVQNQIAINPVSMNQILTSQTVKKCKFFA